MRHFNKNGFTLVEILIYVAVIGFALASFAGFFSYINYAGTTARLMQEVQVNARNAVSLMSQKIQSADQVDIGDSVFDVNPGRLSLQSGGVDVVFSVTASGALVITEGALPAESVIGNKVKIASLVFSRMGALSSRENIRIAMTLEPSRQFRRFTYSYPIQIAVSMRR